MQLRSALIDFRLPGDAAPLRVHWLRLLQYLSFFMAVGGLVGGFGLVIVFSRWQSGWIGTLMGWAFVSPFSGLLLFVVCAFLDTCWLE